MAHARRHVVAGALQGWLTGHACALTGHRRVPGRRGWFPPNHLLNGTWLGGIRIPRGRATFRMAPLSLGNEPGAFVPGPGTLRSIAFTTGQHGGLAGRGLVFESAQTDASTGACSRLGRKRRLPVASSAGLARGLPEAIAKPVSRHTSPPCHARQDVRHGLAQGAAWRSYLCVRMREVSSLSNEWLIGSP